MSFLRNLKVSLPNPQESATGLLVQPVVYLPTRWHRFDNRSCRVCGGRSGRVADFLQKLRFSLPIFIPPNAPHSSTIQSWYNDPYSGLHAKWTQFTNKSRVIYFRYILMLSSHLCLRLQSTVKHR
jgi:hypothetical protein